ncbi:GAF domain-containing protein [Ancylothrix sp. C2]|uniref:GAF domain-containing protein n=1 Tax=Ancylothrix sp. D3o TaxID=2953691 RepID=UPI0021BB2FEF|nr:GAF domain-containing protein [Ancylothrix sp. D3o]MCT7950080.1 GAF domain-containing protein [Ancylothrix sp. D3o]
MAKAFDFDAILYELWHHASLKTAQLLGADRANIFLLDALNYQLVSISPSWQKEGHQENLRAVGGVFDEVIKLKKPVKIGFDFYDDPRSKLAKEEDAKTGYRTYTLLAVPVFNSQGIILGIVEVVNKLNKSEFSESLFPRIDLGGFTKDDESLLTEFLPLLVPVMEKSLGNFSLQNNVLGKNSQQAEILAEEGSFSELMATRKGETIILGGEKASTENNKLLLLLPAIRKISERSFDFDETLQSVMREAKKLANSDRSMVWIVDREKNDLWTKISLAGTFQEIRIPMGAGFAGRVAQTGEPMEMGFDFYDHPDSEAAKQADQQTGYRTCSLLCLPIFNLKGELVGVTHLVNKLRLGNFPPYDPDSWPQAPEAWKASFSSADREVIEALNLQAGIVLENAKNFADFNYQEQLKNDIIRSFAWGVIATNLTGHIRAINPKAKELMGLSDADWLEGRALTDLLEIEEGDLSAYLNTAVTAVGEENRPQTYREKLLVTADKKARKVNVMVQAMGEEPDKKSGVLIVLEEVFAADESIASEGEPKSKKELPKGGKVNITGERKEITVLYSGMRSFTPLLESLEDVEVGELLKEYFNSMSEAVIKYKGTIDKYVGDAIMATFGLPVAQRDHAWSAVQTAIEMRQRLFELNVHRVEEGKQALRMGIGINSDSFFLGNLSTSGRLELTSVGDSLNVGFYLEKASKQYGCDIIISDSTYRLCAERVWARELDSIRVKGKDEPVAIYQLVALRSEELPEEKVQVIEYYSQGRSYYRNREFSQAAEQFSKVLEISSWDIPAAIQLERCQHWLNSPPPAEWDGVWKLTEI